MRRLTTLLLAAPALAQGGPAPLPYDLRKPAHAFELPRELHEISGLTAVDGETLACVQDEKGVLFLVDARTGRSRGAHAFGRKGDYEGLARVGGDFWVLRSDGILLEVAARGTGWTAAASVQLGAPHRELEGLCFDARRGLLLVAPKDEARLVPPDTGEATGKDAGRAAKRARRENEDQRLLWGFDLAARRMLPEPVLRLSVEALVAQAGDSPELPRRAGKKGRERPDLKLRPSCVAVHPGTGEIWLLSAADHLLVAVDRTGALRHLGALDPEQFPRPEGMTFLPDGALVLSTEGVDGPARIRVYAPRKE